MKTHRTALSRQLVTLGIATALLGCGNGGGSGAASDDATDSADAGADAGHADADGGHADADASATDADAGAADADASAADADTSADAAAPDVVADAEPNDAAATDADVTAGADTPDGATADTPPTDVGPTALVAGNLVQATLTFGKCVSPTCKTKLELEGAALLLTVSDHKDEASFMAKGILTTGSAAKLDDLVSALAGKAIPLTTGCPGCDDGGVAKLVFSDGKQTESFSYEQGAPPAALAEIDALVASAVAGLKACVGDAVVVVHKPCPMDLP